MPTVHTTPKDAQFQPLYALGIFTVTDLCHYAAKHGVCPSELLAMAG